MNETLLKIARYEKKYYLTLSEALGIEKRLLSVMPEDSNNKENGYQVRSLYFDTCYNDDFKEKEDGIELRRKIRLRIYDTDSDYVKLECKEKSGDNQFKRSLLIQKNHAQEMCSGQYQCLLNYDSSFAMEMYLLMNEKVYRPKCIIAYQRKAFMLPVNDTRITLDRDIRSSEIDFDIFSNKLNLIPVSQYDEVTLEVKYNQFLLSYVKEAVSVFNKEPLSRSKYIMGRRHTIQPS